MKCASFASGEFLLLLFFCWSRTSFVTCKNVFVLPPPRSIGYSEGGITINRGSLFSNLPFEPAEKGVVVCLN